MEDRGPETRDGQHLASWPVLRGSLRRRSTVAIVDVAGCHCISASVLPAKRDSGGGEDVPTVVVLDHLAATGWRRVGARTGAHGRATEKSVFAPQLLRAKAFLHCIGAPEELVDAGLGELPVGEPPLSYGCVLEAEGPEDVPRGLSRDAQQRLRAPATARDASVVAGFFSDDDVIVGGGGPRGFGGCRKVGQAGGRAAATGGWCRGGRVVATGGCCRGRGVRASGGAAGERGGPRGRWGACGGAGGASGGARRWEDACPEITEATVHAPRGRSWCQGRARHPWLRRRQPQVFCAVPPSGGGAYEMGGQCGLCAKRRGTGAAETAGIGPMEPFAYLGVWLRRADDFSTGGEHGMCRPSADIVAARARECGWHPAA